MIPFAPGHSYELQRIYNPQGYTTAILYVVAGQQFMMHYKPDTGEWAFKDAPSEIVSIEPRINDTIAAEDF